jgi:hypothetical protein
MASQLETIVPDKNRAPIMDQPGCGTLYKFSVSMFLSRNLLNRLEFQEVILWIRRRN